MPQLSLKTKVTLLFPLSTTIVLFCLLFLIQQLLQGYLKESISRHQYQTVSLLADEIDQELVETHRPLLALASKFSPGLISDPEEALAFLLERTESTGIFDNGIFLFDLTGRMVAELPLGVSRSGMDFSYRDYLKATLATKAPFISAPYVSSQLHHHPAIMLTAPIFDSSGNVLAILGGSIDLLGSNFLGGLNLFKVGKTGYMFMFDTDRTVIVHPDKSRIMKQDIPLGANILLDRALAGFDGTDETVNSRGLKALTTFKHMKSKGWIIGSNFPLDEAYQPVRRVRDIFLVSLLLFSLFFFWFVRRYLRYLTSPVAQLADHVKNLPGKKGDERFFQINGSDETATLGRAFNELVRETDRQRLRLEDDLRQYELADQRLQIQNEYLQALHETTLGLIRRLDVASVLQTIVSRSGRLVGTEHCFLYLVNNSGTELDMVYQSGIYESLIHHPVRHGEGVSGRVWDTGEPLKVNDYSLWEGRLPDNDRNILHAMAGVPLKVDDKVVGVLGLAFIDEGATFSDQQMEVLAQFGELASLALANARLNEESQRELVERKRAEENLRKLSVAVEQSPASIIITDSYGIIEYVNPHFTALTGYTFEEAVGQTPAILKTGETSTEEYRKLWQTIREGGDWRGEFHNRNKDGELYWEQALIAPIRDANGLITHFIAIKEDITVRKQLEGQLRHSQKMDAIGQLAGGIAHDFNNILTAIVGYASIMQLKLPDDSPLKNSAEQIAATAERGASLTQGLLAFSRKQASNPVVVDLNEVIIRVHQLLLRLISEDIHLEINLEQQVLPILADSGQIEQVLMNLSTNARDAMPQGGLIVVSTESVVLGNEFVLARGFGRPGKYVLLTFTDNGDGMDVETVKHIFEPFYTTKVLGKGTGLGLSIIYGIIKKHNGFILCHSTIGLGTIFQIYLPLQDSTPAVPVEKLLESIDGDIEINSIMLAEENDSTRALGREILEEFGYFVIEAVDGEDAIEKFRELNGRISLVLLDVNLSKMKGPEVCTAMRSIDRNVRIVFCSDDAQDVIISQGLSEEEINFLPKPFTPKELLMKIREVLDNEY
jgi:PAS domain S-box-containing protein